MRARSPFASLVVVCALAPACGSGDAPPPTAEALFGATSMADTPWPSDFFLRDGRIVPGAIPLDGQPGPLAALEAALSELDGAPVYTSTFFPTGGGLDAGPLEGKAEWIDLDDAAARVVKTSLFYRAETRELVALAPRDAVLTAGHRYGVVVTSPRVRPSAQMRDALEGRGPHAALYAPLRGRVVGDVSAATVFAVGHPARVTDEMRAVAAAGPPPRAKVTRVVRGAELDAFLGAPTTTRPGIGDPRGIVHEAVGTVVFGSFETPSFLSSAPPQLGRVEMDADGKPRVKGAETVPFLLALPHKPAGGFASMPVLVFQHGLNAGRSQVLAVANDYARAGYATIGIDALWHGDRAPRPVDNVHNFTGASGPDGLADADDFGAATNLFDFGGDAAQGIGPFDARVVRDNFRQAIVDVTELVRLVHKGDLTAVAAADPALAGLSLDASTLVYTGESFGSVVGAGAVAVTPELTAAVLCVGGAGIFLPTFPTSPTFAGLVTPFLRSTFDTTLTVTDPALPGEAQRSLSLVEGAFGPGDPLAFAPLLADRKKDVLFFMARSDEAFPNQSTELLAAAARATFVTLPAHSEPPRFVTLPTAAAPWKAEGRAGLVQLSPAVHTMYTAFGGEARYQPDFPPFVLRDTPARVESPTELLHALALDFARTRTISALP
ncbi:MAG: hypothetical protein KC657_32170 [Myxococcales bacterium]|nr:hypothetical protein [Myxococcales bacterium]